VVAVNSDVSVRQLGKGTGRPINREGDRAALVAALQSVDLVTIFAERVPLATLERVRPNIYVKGGDYDVDTLPEAALVRTWGGRAVAIPFVHDRSTTDLLARVRSLRS
jgi:rfaE bifunctional protein nucleotidyltransferase chain/domain